MLSDCCRAHVLYTMCNIGVPHSGLIPHATYCIVHLVLRMLQT